MFWCYSEMWKKRNRRIRLVKHWGRDKMAAISQTTVSNAFSWMKMYQFTISLKFVHRGPNNNIPAWVQKMVWRRPGDKPLSEPMMVSFPTHICVTRPQWVNPHPTRRTWPSFCLQMSQGLTISKHRLPTKLRRILYDIYLLSNFEYVP